MTTILDLQAEIGTHVTIRGLDKSFSGAVLYDNFNLDIPKGKIVSIFGPNGCGKSTLINMISGLMSIDSGELVNLFEIKFNLNLYPYELSGGQMQTVSIMRALAPNPEILFLDEPFSALDFEMTLFIRAKLQEANLTTGVTMMIVSHDLEDAVFLADKILLLTRRPTRIAEYLKFDMAKPRSPESVSEAEFIKTKALALEIFQREMRA